MQVRFIQRTFIVCVTVFNLIFIQETTCQNNLPDGIIVPICVIATDSNRQMMTAFRYAQSRYNNIRTNPFSLASWIDQIDVSDSYTLAQKMCERMATGVFLFVGVKSMASLDLLQSLTRTFHMPYLSPSTTVQSQRLHPGYEIHLKPEFSAAIVDMINYFQWTNIHYVYDSDEGLHHIQVVLLALRNVTNNGSLRNVHVSARRIYNVEHAHDELRQLDKMNPEQEETYKVIIFDLSSEEAYRNILRQIPEVGMNKDGYHYLIATLDFVNMDMRRYLHGGVNITGFQLIDLENEQVKKFGEIWHSLEAPYIYPVAGSEKLSETSFQYEAALAVDAVDVITLALTGMVTGNSKIFQSTFRRKELYNHNRTRGIPCTTQPPVPWMHGDAIMEQIKKLDFEGLTGRVRFDDHGFRTNYKIDVYTVGLDLGPTKIGSWTPDERFRNLYEVESESLQNITIHNRLTIIVTIDSPPFFMKMEVDKQKRGIPYLDDKKYEGYVKDLTMEIAEKTKFEYRFKLVDDNKYGRYDPINDTWDGMIGELLYGKADVCIAPLTITYDREKVVDFTKPFMNFGISIMIKKPETTKPGVFSFMEPLETKIWICIIFAYCSISVGLFLVSRFSPYEWKNSNIGPVHNDFNLLNALWFSVGALMLQGNDACPRSFSGRVIGTVWWFFVLIIISSYTANLAAFLTIERMQTPIESADDLAMQTEIKYGTLESGTTFEFFKISKVPTYQRMYNFMSSNPSVFVKTNQEGVERVRKSKEKYAFLLESPFNEYTNYKKPCDTMKVGPSLNAKTYGIATPKGSLLSEDMNLAVLMLMEDQTLPKLHIKWWREKGGCAVIDAKDSSGKRELSLSNVAGIFYIIIGGLALAIIVASIEFLCINSKLKEKPYLKTAETFTTLLSPAQTPGENVEFGSDKINETSRQNDQQDHTAKYSIPTPSIGFEHFTQEHTDLW